jgi:hypothetical protein
MGSLSQYWANIQSVLPGFLELVLEPLTKKQRQLAYTLELARIEEFVQSQIFGRGRKPSDRSVLARAFIAKSVYNLPSTRSLICLLESCPNIRRICGWERSCDIPHESTFSRAFADFTRLKLPEIVHQALVEKTQGTHITGNLCRDSTAVSSREKAKTKPKPARVKTHWKQPSFLQLQPNMTPQEILQQVSQVCTFGTKKNSQGKPSTWRGYKLHLDCSDAQIPISCVLTSAHVHDSQVAVALSKLSEQRVDALYELMDSAYDAKVIKSFVRAQKRVPIIDPQRRRGQKTKPSLAPHKAERYKIRTCVERVFARLKEDFGLMNVMVRGPDKVMTHAMFAVLAFTADQLMKLVGS